MSTAVSATQPGSRPVLSRHLRVRVEEACHVKVDLTFRASAAEFLSDLIPEDLLEKLRARSIDLDTIVARTVQKQFAPGELFQLLEGTKKVSVWLE